MEIVKKLSSLISLLYLITKFLNFFPLILVLNYNSNFFLASIANPRDFCFIEELLCDWCLNSRMAATGYDVY